MAREAAIAAGLGALAEELLARRVDGLKLRELRQKILREVEEEAGKRGAWSAAELVRAAVARHAPRLGEVLGELGRPGADPVRALLESAVKGLAEVLRLDVPVAGGRTLGDLLYEGQDEVLDRLHEVAVALLMRYAELSRTCGRACPPETARRLERLALLELAACTAYRLKRADALRELVDEILRSDLLPP